MPAIACGPFAADTPQVANDLRKKCIRLTRMMRDTSGIRLYGSTSGVEKRRFPEGIWHIPLDS